MDSLGLDSPRGTATMLTLYVYPVTLSTDCKSTLQAEILARLWGVEPGVRIRAAVADARGVLGTGKKLPTNWEDEPAMSMRHLWMTDCERLVEHLVAPTMGKTEDERLSSDLCRLMQ
eukprot:395129-Pyramimonas_sp.AAC.1